MRVTFISTTRVNHGAASAAPEPAAQLQLSLTDTTVTVCSCSDRGALAAGRFRGQLILHMLAAHILLKNEEHSSRHYTDEVSLYSRSFDHRDSGLLQQGEHCVSIEFTYEDIILFLCMPHFFEPPVPFSDHYLFTLADAN